MIEEGRLITRLINRIDYSLKKQYSNKGTAIHVELFMNHEEVVLLRKILREYKHRSKEN